MERKVFRYRQVDSTNTEASRLLADGSITGESYVITDSQPGGRGRGDHVWTSEVGKNLMLSWVVQPAFLSVSAQFQLSKAVSLAVTGLLKSFGLHALIKWPNDIICNGKKIAGILIENRVMGSRLMHSIVGIGINVNQRSFPEFSMKATSMCLESDGEFSLPRVETALMDQLEREYAVLQQGRNERINERYSGQLFMLNRTCQFSDGEKVFSGTLKGVDENGQLLVETSESREVACYGFHEIRMIT